MTLIDRSTATYKVLLRVLDEMYGVSKSYHDAIDETAAMRRKPDETPHHLEIASKHVSGIKRFSITVVVGQLRPAANECNRSPLVPTNRP